MDEEAPDFLLVDTLVTGYGKKQVLNGVTVQVGAGEIVALIGHNGAGKSTCLKAVFGMLPIWTGSVVLDGIQLNALSPRERIRAGVAYVPQGNRVFGDFTVRENLEMGGVTLPDRVQVNDGIERVFTLFPALKTRFRQRAATLSGGEKQMLALGNALVLSPRLLLLDEPSLGLAPHLVTEALRHIREISEKSRTAVMIVEQKVREVFKIARRVYVFKNGHISYSGLAQSLSDETKLREAYL